MTGAATGISRRAAARGPGTVVTLYDVARLAGVSTATVSRVVHGQDRVRDSTRARVLRVIDQLGYVPDGAAQSLSRRRKNVIGLVCVERQSPRQQYDIESMSLLFYDEILRGVEARIRDHNWSLLISYLREAATDPDLPRLLSLSGQVNGMLIGEGVVPSEFLARLAKRLPVVVIAGNPDERAADVVMADNRSGSAALVCHLIEDHGRRRLYHVDGPPSAPDAKERRLALTELVAANPQCQLVGSSQGSVHRPQRRGGGRETARCLRRAIARRGRLRERPDGHRGAPGVRRGRGAGARAGRGGRLRRHLPRQLVRPAAHDRSPADAAAGRAGVHPAAGPHRPAGHEPEGGTAADRARAALQLRLPARHRDAPGRIRPLDASRSASGPAAPRPARPAPPPAPAS